MRKHYKPFLGLPESFFNELEGGNGIFSKINGKISTFTLLLAGIAISSLCSAFMYALMIAFRDKMENIIMWSMGSFSGITLKKLLFILPIFALSYMGLILFRRQMDKIIRFRQRGRSLRGGRDGSLRHAGTGAQQDQPE